MNLPYLVDGSHVITQSNACYLYLGRKFGLNGGNDVEMSRVEQVLMQDMDLRNDITKVSYGSKMEDVCKFAREGFRGHYEKLEDFMKQNNTRFTAADSPTTSDFHLFELLDQVEAMCKTCGSASALAEFPRLSTLYNAFATMDRLAGYRASAQAKYPINNKTAVFK